MEEKIVASTALEKYEYSFVQYTLGEMDYHSSQTLKFLQKLQIVSYFFILIWLNQALIKMAFWSKSGDYIDELFTFVSREFFLYLVPVYIIGFNIYKF